MQITNTRTVNCLAAIWAIALSAEVLLVGTASARATREHPHVRVGRISYNAADGRVLVPVRLVARKHKVTGVAFRMRYKRRLLDPIEGASRKGAAVANTGAVFQSVAAPKGGQIRVLVLSGIAWPAPTLGSGEVAVMELDVTHGRIAKTINRLRIRGKSEWQIQKRVRRLVRSAVRVKSVELTDEHGRNIHIKSNRSSRQWIRRSGMH